jgi:hypothetical protein
MGKSSDTLYTPLTPMKASTSPAHHPHGPGSDTSGCLPCASGQLGAQPYFLSATKQAIGCVSGTCNRRFISVSDSLFMRLEAQD